MKKHNRQSVLLQIVVIWLIIIVIPQTAHSQNVKTDKDSKKNMFQKVAWLDNKLNEELDDITKWYIYDMTIAECDSLNNVVLNTEKKRDKHANQLQEWQKQLAAIYMCKGQTIGPSYSQCDTQILLLQEGMYGDTAVDRQQTTLLTCRRIEDILARRYNAEVIKDAREMLASIDDQLPNEYSDLDERLEQYSSMRENLKTALSEANNRYLLNISDSLSQMSIDRYTERFFDKLEESLNRSLLTPNDYPYLYGILNKAMQMIMDDPRNDISKLIEEL